MAVYWVSLLKPRIVGLLVFVALGAAFLAAQGTPAPPTLLLLALTGTLAAGGAGALNHYLERDRDALMERTRGRPLVARTIARPVQVLALGLACLALAAALTLPSNLSQGLFMLAGAFVYVVVYTLWLKRRSPLNIVVGGLAGSCAVLTGWAAVAPWWEARPLLLALLLFLWTPPHFWSLAIMHLEDYRQASVPMLPVVVGTKTAALWGLLHVLLLLAVSAALAEAASLGPIYRVGAAVAGLALLSTAFLQAWSPSRPAARRHFLVSIVYLAAVFAALGLDVAL